MRCEIKNSRKTTVFSYILFATPPVFRRFVFKKDFFSYKTSKNRGGGNVN